MEECEQQSLTCSKVSGQPIAEGLSRNELSVPRLCVPSSKGQVPIRISVWLAIHGRLSGCVMCPTAETCLSCRFQNAPGQRRRTWRGSWACFQGPRVSSCLIYYSPKCSDFTVEPTLPPKGLGMSTGPKMHGLSIMPKGEQAYWTASESKPSSCMPFVFMTGGRSLHEGQLVNQGTESLRSCRSLHEIVTGLVAFNVSVHRVARVPCPLGQRLQKKEPAS